MDGGMGEQLAKTFIAAVASRDSAAWAAMFTDDATYAIPEAPEPVRGREALDAMASMFFEAFPDMPSGEANHAPAAAHPRGSSRMATLCLTDRSVVADPGHVRINGSAWNEEGPGGSERQVAVGTC